MADVAPDTLLGGRYRIEARLGSGGMADVYRAHDDRLGREVALKLLHRRFSADEEFVERFRREASSAASLSHPHVVGVYDRGEWEGTYYIAMEYLPGRALKQLVRDEAPLDPVRAIDLTGQILRAARFAHRRGVIHRDLKPHNVIVDDEDRVKVTDFGIARAGASDMTETGSIMGTAQYLSPEQAQGHAVTAASDLYAVGVVLYELLTARVPFDGESAVTIALKHVSELPTPPSAHNPAVPPELDAVVLRALDKDPAGRYTNADEFLAALGHARERITGVSGGVALATATHVPIGAAVALPGSEGNGALAPAPPHDGEPPGDAYLDDGAEPDGEARRSRMRRWLPWLIAAVILALIGGGVAAGLLLGGPQVTVPNEVGHKLTAARRSLEGVGLRVAVRRRADRRAPDTVISEAPRSGERVDKGSTVTLTVSGGPGRVAVPDVADSPRRAAQRKLAQVGLRSRVALRPSSGVQAGFVVRTEPPARTTVDKGQTVTLVVSSGAPMATVPGVVGDSQSMASAAISSAGLSPSVSYRNVNSSSQDGVVVSQSPGGGATAPSGATVTIVVGQYSAPAPTPPPTATTPPPMSTTPPPTTSTTPPPTTSTTPPPTTSTTPPPTSTGPSGGGGKNKGGKPGG